MPIEVIPRLENVTSRMGIKGQTLHLSVTVRRRSQVHWLSEEPTLDDLPDQVFVALGRRGMEGIPLKKCTYACDSDELELIEVVKDPPSISGVSGGVLPFCIHA